MFFNELDILEGRLEYLYDTVDYFVIVETTVTHSGLPKPLNYLANSKRYQKYADKILYMPFAADTNNLDFSYKPKTTEMTAVQWVMENTQRSYITKALELFDDNAIVMISDVDEIPNKNKLRLAMANLKKPSWPAISLLQRMFYYNFNQQQAIPWHGTVVTTNKFAKQQGPQWLRDQRRSLPSLDQGGWHLSYWGGVDKIQTKIASLAHQENNVPEFTDPEHIKSKIASGKDLFNRNIDYVPVDPSTIPQDMLSVFGKYVGVPHYWHTVEGFFNPEDIEFYRQVVAVSVDNLHFVEVGSYKGRSSSFMAVEILNSGKQIRFDCVDTWQGSEEHQAGQQFEDADVVNDRLFDVFKNNMKLVEGHYNTLRLPSVEAAEQYEDNSLDFVFIDAAHDYDNVKADITAWLPKLKQGGILAGHDYPYPPVRRAVNEMLGDLPSIGACWFKQI